MNDRFYITGKLGEGAYGLIYKGLDILNPMNFGLNTASSGE